MSGRFERDRQMRNRPTTNRGIVGFAAMRIIWTLAAAGCAPREAPASEGRADTSASEDSVREQNARVVEEFFAALEAMDVERFLAVWAEDGVQVMPFSPPGFPQRLEGREAIRNQYRSLPENYRSMRFPREIVAMEDPDRFLVRYTGEIELKSGGRYDNTYVGLMTLRDGRVTEFVEYFNPLVLQQAFGDALQQNFNVAGDGK